MPASSLTADDVKRLLNLQPHPREGGFYIRTHESSEYLAREQFTDVR